VSAQVAATYEPLVVVLDDAAAREPDERAVVGEVPDDVGAPALAVDPLERFVAPSFGP